jgi:hypothetical protein
MLLDMMRLTKADTPAVRRLEAHATVRPAPDMSTFDRERAATVDRATVLSDPCAVRRGSPRYPIARFARQTIRKSQLRHLLSPSSLPNCLRVSIWIDPCAISPASSAFGALLVGLRSTCPDPDTGRPVRGLVLSADLYSALGRD